RAADDRRGLRRAAGRGGLRLVSREARPQDVPGGDRDHARGARRRLRPPVLSRHTSGTDPSEASGYPRAVPVSTGQRLLRFDRPLDARFVAGADEAGRGSLAGPLVVAGVLLAYATLRGHRVRRLALLNDSK